MVHGQTHFRIYPTSPEDNGRITALLHDYQPSATLENEEGHLLYRTYYPTNRAALQRYLGCDVEVRRHLADISTGFAEGGAEYNYN